jgi:nitrogen regulatory protein P-II 1
MIKIIFKLLNYTINKLLNQKTMKKVEAIIRKSKFEEVVEALHNVEVNFFSYWDVTGVGNEKEGHVYRGISYSTSEIQRRYLSIVVNDEFVDKTVEAITKSAATDQIGDGKIFILPVDEAYRIRTGEKGGKSLN